MGILLVVLVVVLVAQANQPAAAPRVPAPKPFSGFDQYGPPSPLGAPPPAGTGTISDATVRMLGAPTRPAWGEPSDWQLRGNGSRSFPWEWVNTVTQEHAA